MAFLDLQANGEQLQVATRAKDLAASQLTQARDRFAAGVADNIEVVQAQEAVALASEQYIAGLYSYNVAKAALARALGVAEEAVAQISRRLPLMADQPEGVPFTKQGRVRIAVLVLVVALLGVGGWLWLTAGQRIDRRRAGRRARDAGVCARRRHGPARGAW